MGKPPLCSGGTAGRRSRPAARKGEQILGQLRKSGSPNRQQRTIQQEHSAKDFSPSRDLESADVLCVPQAFRTDGSAENARRRPKLQLCCVAKTKTGSLLAQRSRFADRRGKYRPGGCIAFSTHLAAYVARRAPFFGSKVEMPLMSPMVPMEIRSS